MSVSWASDWLSSPSVWATYRLKATKLSDYGRTLQIEPQQSKGTPMEPKYRYFSSYNKGAYYRADESKPAQAAVYVSEDQPTGASLPNDPTLVELLDEVIAGGRKEITKEAAEALVKPKVTLKVGQIWRERDDTYLLANVVAGEFALIALTGCNIGYRWAPASRDISGVFGTSGQKAFTLLKDA